MTTQTRTKFRKKIMPDDAIKVAVRVRPFNDREKARNATLVIEMEGQRTGIRDPANLKAEPKWFSFDYSYWSHDGFKDNDGMLEKTSPKYADQV
jgi:kinesin family protein 1